MRPAGRRAWRSWWTSGPGCGRGERQRGPKAALQSSSRARVEDLSVFKVRKETKKGKELEYWHAAWMVEGKTRNVYLGSCKKMSREEALERARKLKVEELGIEK